MTPADLLEHRLADTITAAEYDVILLRIRGLSHRQISLALDISRWSVRDREHNGYRKIELHHRKEPAA